MPSCQDCNWKEGQHCHAHKIAREELKRPIPPPPTGACTIAIVDAYLPLIKKGMKVLEIGCGTWKKVYDHCQKVGAHFEGLDIKDEYYGIKCIATRYENLADLSFSDNEFDVVIGNQTMEHWGEFGCTLEWGLYQCFRVLKPGGKLLINVPMHFHGTKYFVHGKKDSINNLFSKFSNDIKMEAWGYPSDPIKPFYPHPRFNKLKNKPAHALDIRAVKDKDIPKNINNRLGFNGKLAQIFHYSFSYNLYRLKKKVLNEQST